MLPVVKRILYATEMGPGAPYVFRYALALAERHNAEIIAISVLEQLSPFARSLVELHVSPAQAKEIHAEARRQAGDKLRQRIEKLCRAEEGGAKGASRVSEILIEEGQPAQTILTAARKCDADLIIMGSHRHTVLGDAVLGSTAHKVLHGASRPVLVVRIPEGYREEGF